MLALIDVADVVHRSWKLPWFTTVAPLPKGLPVSLDPAVSVVPNGFSVLCVRRACRNTRVRPPTGW